MSDMDQPRIINSTTTLQDLQSLWGELHRVTPGHGSFMCMGFADEDEPLTQESSGERTDCAVDAFTKSYFIEIVEPFLDAIDGDEPLLLTDLLRSIGVHIPGYRWGYYIFRYIHILGTRDPRFLAELTAKLIDLDIADSNRSGWAIELYLDIDLPVEEIEKRWSEAGHRKMSREALLLILGDIPPIPSIQETEDRTDSEFVYDRNETGKVYFPFQVLNLIENWANSDTVQTAARDPESRNIAYYQGLEYVSFAFGWLLESLSDRKGSLMGPFMRRMFLDLICIEVKRSSRDIEVPVRSLRNTLFNSQADLVEA